MVVYSNRASTALFTTMNSNMDLPTVNQTATVIGHGRTVESEQVSSNELKEAVVRVIPFADCEKSYDPNPDTKMQSNVTFYATQVTGVNCNDDSGGPLIDPNTGAVIGIVSFGSTTGLLWVTRGLHPFSTGSLTPFAVTLQSNLPCVRIASLLLW